MNKEQIDEIRLKARKVVIKSYIIDLIHQLYRNIWLKLSTLMTVIQLMLVIATVIIPICGAKTLSTSLVTAIGSWIFCIFIILGTVISNKAYEKSTRN